ncbi:type II secretion system protein M, partial [Xylella fastidiosa subsp. multiplex]|nr:type II secretion system protein M [Xylella fastidiosa subsp. multiplex]
MAAAAVDFTVLIEPALNSTRKLRDELPQLRAQAASVAEVAAQASALRGKAAAPA